MANRLLIVGVILFVVGALIFVASLFAGGSMNTNLPPSSSGAYLEVQPTFLGGGTISISWSGGNTNTTVTIYSCPSGSCPATVSPSELSQVANGTGSSGSFSVSVTGGQQYLIGQSGNSGTLAVTDSGFGLSILGIIGLVLAIVGTVLIILPRRTPPAPAEEAAPEEAPQA